MSVFLALGSSDLGMRPTEEFWRDRNKSKHPTGPGRVSPPIPVAKPSSVAAGEHRKIDAENTAQVPVMPSVMKAGPGAKLRVVVPE